MLAPNSFCSMSFIALISFFFGCTALGEEGSTNAGGMRGKVIVLFNDQAVFRRVPNSAPLMGSGYEDYEVRIACLDAGHCKAKIPRLMAVLEARTETREVCDQSHARIQILPDTSLGGENDVFDLDRFGTCMTHAGKTYRLKKSIFGVLSHSISRW